MISSFSRISLPRDRIAGGAITEQALVLTVQNIPITLLLPDWVSYSERERIAALLQRPLLDPSILKGAIKHLQDIHTEAQNDSF